MKKKEVRGDKKFREGNKILAKMGFRNLRVQILGPQVTPQKTTSFYYADESMNVVKSDVGIEAEVSTENLKWFEVPKECMKDFGTMGGDKVSPGASDRDKWFESPNASGYLDM